MLVAAIEPCCYLDICTHAMAKGCSVYPASQYSSNPAITAPIVEACMSFTAACGVDEGREEESFGYTPRKAPYLLLSPVTTHGAPHVECESPHVLSTGCEPNQFPSCQLLSTRNE